MVTRAKMKRMASPYCLRRRMIRVTTCRRRSESGRRRPKLCEQAPRAGFGSPAPRQSASTAASTPSTGPQAKARPLPRSSPRRAGGSRGADP
jgi:hypothetical protein